MQRVADAAASFGKEVLSRISVYAQAGLGITSAQTEMDLNGGASASFTPELNTNATGVAVGVKVGFMDQPANYHAVSGSVKAGAGSIVINGAFGKGMPVLTSVAFEIGKGFGRNGSADPTRSASTPIPGTSPACIWTQGKCPH